MLKLPQEKQSCQKRSFATLQPRKNDYRKNLRSAALSLKLKRNRCFKSLRAKRTRKFARPWLMREFRRKSSMKFVQPRKHRKRLQERPLKNRKFSFYLSLENAYFPFTLFIAFNNNVRRIIASMRIKTTIIPNTNKTSTNGTSTPKIIIFVLSNMSLLLKVSLPFLEGVKFIFLNYTIYTFLYKDSYHNTTFVSLYDLQYK